MHTGSTGLGKMTLKMNVINESEVTRMPPTSPPENSLVVYCKTYDPVIWNVWISVEPEEVPALMGQLLKPKLLWFVFKALIKAPFKSRRKKLTVLGGADKSSSRQTSVKSSL